MERYRLQTLFVGLFLGLAATNGQTADLRDGFMETSWETNLATAPSFLKIEEKGELSYYVNPTVIHVIGDIKVPKVIYGSYLSKFFAVYIHIDKSEVYNQMKNYISEKYGRPKMTMQINPDRTAYTWKYHQTKIKLKLNEETGDMKLAFYHTPLSNKVNESLLEEFQEKEKRFNIDKERAVETLDLLKF